MLPLPPESVERFWTRCFAAHRLEGAAIIVPARVPRPRASGRFGPTWSMTPSAPILDRSGLRDVSWQRFVARWLGVSLVLVLAAAFHSDGFHHPDEYFQTLEFAG